MERKVGITEKLTKLDMQMALIEAINKITKSDDYLNIASSKNEIYLCTLHAPPVKKQTKRWTISIKRGY